MNETNWKIKTSIKIGITSFLFIYLSLLAKLNKNIIYIRLYSFVSGLLLFFILFELAYLVVWSNFIRIGKKSNLKTIRCKSCRNYFYLFNYETIEFCSNCTLLNFKEG